MPVNRVLLTPEEKRQRLRESQRKYYMKNRERIIAQQLAYKRSLDTQYTEAQKRSIYKQREKNKAKKLNNSL